MKERPILFSTPMVQAILSGKKEQTRRIIKPQPVIDSDSGYVYDFTRHYAFDIHKWKEEYLILSKYQKKTILWVRETWLKCTDGYIYRADHFGDTLLTLENGKTFDKSAKWKPSIFMPREACRIRLEITDIRVERVQDISEADAIKEGAPDSMSIDELKVMQGMDWIIPNPFQMHQFGFMAIWCKINGQKSWLDNPWVYVISFKKL